MEVHCEQPYLTLPYVQYQSQHIIQKRPSALPVNKGNIALLGEFVLSMTETKTQCWYRNNNWENQKFIHSSDRCFLTGSPVSHGLASYLLTRFIKVRYFHRPPYVRAPGCRSDISKEQLVRSVKTYHANIAKWTHKHDLQPRPVAAIFGRRYFRMSSAALFEDFIKGMPDCEEIRQLKAFN